MPSLPISLVLRTSSNITSEQSIFGNSLPNPTQSKTPSRHSTPLFPINQPVKQLRNIQTTWLAKQHGNIPSRSKSFREAFFNQLISPDPQRQFEALLRVDLSGRSSQVDPFACVLTPHFDNLPFISRKPRLEQLNTMLRKKKTQCQDPLFTFHSISLVDVIPFGLASFATAALSSFPSSTPVTFLPPHTTQSQFQPNLPYIVPPIISFNVSPCEPAQTHLNSFSSIILTVPRRTPQFCGSKHSFRSMFALWSFVHPFSCRKDPHNSPAGFLGMARGCVRCSEIPHYLSKELFLREKEVSSDEQVERQSTVDFPFILVPSTVGCFNLRLITHNSFKMIRSSISNHFSRLPRRRLRRLVSDGDEVETILKKQAQKRNQDRDSSKKNKHQTQEASPIPFVHNPEVPTKLTNRKSQVSTFNSLQTPTKVVFHHSERKQTIPLAPSTLAVKQTALKKSKNHLARRLNTVRDRITDFRTVLEYVPQSTAESSSTQSLTTLLNIKGIDPRKISRDRKRGETRQATPHSLQMNADEVNYVLSQTISTRDRPRRNLPLKQTTLDITSLRPKNIPLTPPTPTISQTELDELRRSLTEEYSSLSLKDAQVFHRTLLPSAPYPTISSDPTPSSVDAPFSQPDTGLLTLDLDAPFTIPPIPPLTSPVVEVRSSQLGSPTFESTLFSPVPIPNAPSMSLFSQHVRAPYSSDPHRFIESHSIIHDSSRITPTMFTLGETPTLSSTLQDSLYPSPMFLPSAIHNQKLLRVTQQSVDELKAKIANTHALIKSIISIVFELEDDMPSTPTIDAFLKFHKEKCDELLKEDSITPTIHSYESLFVDCLLTQSFYSLHQTPESVHLLSLNLFYPPSSLDPSFTSHYTNSLKEVFSTSFITFVKERLSQVKSKQTEDNPTRFRLLGIELTLLKASLERGHIPSSTDNPSVVPHYDASHLLTQSDVDEMTRLFSSASFGSDEKRQSHLNQFQATLKNRYTSLFEKSLAMIIPTGGLTDFEKDLFGL